MDVLFYCYVKTNYISFIGLLFSEISSCITNGGPTSLVSEL
jgi:hypothetical protein